MSWLFVPRLRADGWLRIGGREHRFDNDLAYHDHNWGRFWWGDDFGWTWAHGPSQRSGRPVVAGVPADDRPATAALPVPGALRVAPRRACRDLPACRGADALVRRARPRRRTAPCRHRCGCCWMARCRAYRSGRDHRDAGRRHGARRVPPAVLRPAGAAERDVPRPTRLCSAKPAAPRGSTGSINGEDIDFVGTGVFEFLHG